MKKIICIFLTLALTAAVFASCAGPNGMKEPNSDKSDNGGLKIVTTIFPIYDWVKNITGQSDIVYLDENGIDLHSFEPTANDIIKLADADIFIYIGGESDKWVDGAVSSAKNTDLVTLSLLDAVGAVTEETIEGMDAHDEETAADEHIWLSLKKAEKAVKVITEVLCKADSEHTDVYQKNADAYTATLRSLDEKYASAVAASSLKTLLFADRFPFRYMTEDYNLRYFAAFPGCSAESEASFETVSFLINKTKELSLPCIIKLEGSDGKLAETLRSETNADVLTMNSCQSVKQNDITNGVTYISIMEENLKILTEALS